MAFGANRLPDAPDRRNTSGPRIVVFILSAAQALLPLWLIVFIARHANPMGDGMEWVGMVPALLLAGLSATPGLILSISNRWLIGGLLWAIAGVLLNYAFYAEVVSELSH
jgi:hypothetical protein